MITNNAMQLKAFIKKKAVEHNIPAQYVMQNYMMERLLERISISQYRNNFILKGGFLISAIVGIDTRTTMDLDTTIKGFDLSHSNIRQIFSEICEIPIKDNVIFEILDTNEIREADEYPGIRVSLSASYPPMKIPIKADVTTGDVITPGEIEYSFPLMFGNKKINILAYNIDTMLAEKIETVLSRSIANTRPRDFYDIHVLYHTYSKNYRPEALRDALKHTSEKRGSYNVIKRYPEIIEDILASKQMQDYWVRYQKNFTYAAETSFYDVCNTLNEIFKTL